ncbi:ABC transporter substrate-binding protein [Haladaptatus sp. CMSO5]|uniref:ABC transporter substrate-binding protein n=1 Tax=Haladaptatus sp. CMSO5 TaxID=3120514 RepID=UPI002FCDE95C
MKQSTESQDQPASTQSRRRFMQAAGAAGLLSVAGCLGGGGGSGGEGTLSIPGLYDQSGPTSDVGRPTALGSRDAFKWINEEGIIDQEINHNGVDYAYDVAQANQQYDEFTSDGTPPIIIGWGTADTEALAPKVARDKIVYISASYSAKLLTEEAPYNFFGNLDYTSQARAHLKWIADNDPDGKVAFIFSNTSFGKAPVEGGKAYAEELGLEVGDDIDLPLTANSATTQLRKAKDDQIDYLIHQNTAAPMQVLLKDRQDVYPEVNVMGLTYTVDELRVQESPETFEGVRYASGFKTFAEVMEGSGQGKDAIEASFEREGRDMEDPGVANLNYVRGVIHAMVALKGIQEATNLDLDPSMGENIRSAMFEISDWDVFGLAEPFTYEEDDRRPTMTGRIYQVEDGEMKFDSKAELPRRDDWIGL